jgi:hypothetical protein
MPSTVIENHEPSDEGWSVVLGRFVRPPGEQEDSSAESQSQPEQPDEDDS